MNNVPKNCFNCPSLVRADDTSFFRKSIGVSVCSRHGKVIGTVNSTEREKDKLATHFASNCPDFGALRPGSPDWSKLSMTVMLPDPSTIGQSKNNPDMVRSCAGCANFVREDIVLKELGWAGGMCAAKGKILLANRYTLEARGCEDRTFGSVRTSTTGLTFLPEYEENFIGNGDPVKAYKKDQANFVPPEDYETDAPVSEADVAHGIRAWRKIEDELTGNYVMLPIYASDFFTEAEREKIPHTGDDEHPEDYVDYAFNTYKVAVLWTQLDETPALWGRAGLGKTELGRHLAWLMQIPFERISITGSTELDDLAGKMHFTEGVGTHFEYGRLPKAWMKPNVIMIDEPNTGPADVWQFLRPLTDNSKQLVLDMNAGERITRHDDAYLIMAMNPAWDLLNVGAQMIGDADANRLMHLQFDLPPASLEREIIKKKTAHDGYDIPEDTLDMVMKIAEDLRALTEEGTLSITWAIRPQLKVARALRWFDPLTAYRMAASDYLEPAQAQILLDVVKTHMEA